MKQDRSVALFLPVRLLKNHRAITSDGLNLSLERERNGPMFEEAGPESRDYGVAGSPEEGLCDPALHGAVRMGMIQSVQDD